MCGTHLPSLSKKSSHCVSVRGRPRDELALSADAPVSVAPLTLPAAASWASAMAQDQPPPAFTPSWPYGSTAGRMPLPPQRLVGWTRCASQSSRVVRYCSSTVGRAFAGAHCRQSRRHTCVKVRCPGVPAGGAYSHFEKSSPKSDPLFWKAHGHTKSREHKSAP